MKSLCSLMPGAVFLLFFYGGPTHAQVYVTAGDPEIVQSLSFTTTDPSLVNPTGDLVVDITFPGGNVKGNIPVEGFVIPVIAPTCDCWSSPLQTPSVARVAYYFLYTPGSSLLEGDDGIFIQSAPNEPQLCVNQVKRGGLLGDNVVSILPGKQDCLELPSIFPIVYEVPIITEYMDKIDWKNPGRLPDPICLSCPPWEGYEKTVVELNEFHKENLLKQLPVLIESLEQLQ